MSHSAKAHTDGLKDTIAAFHAPLHADHHEHHEHHHKGVLKGINNAALHFLQLAAHVKKSFPESERPHFYSDLQTEVHAAEAAAGKFNEMKATLTNKGLQPKDVELALEGQMVAIQALFANLKAADPQFATSGASIQQHLETVVNGAIATYSK